jgi:NTE family protein
VDLLREIVADLFEFERLRKECRQRLYIAATHVRTGKLRLFETAELSSDTLLASACLPALHHAVILDGEAYWDGAYFGNPALFPLFYACDARDDDRATATAHPPRPANRRVRHPQPHR